MGGIQRVGSLEIGQDLDFQQRSWTVQRVGWAVIALIIVAALLGLFGGAGPLSTATAGEENGPLWAKYQRFVRFQAPTEVQLSVGPTAVQDGQIRLWLSRAFLDKIEVQRITPEPDEVELAGDRVIYTYRSLSPNGPAAIAINYEADAIGPLEARAGLEGGATLDFSQFVYP